MAEYSIQDTTLTAIADKIRQYTDRVGDGTHRIADKWIQGESQYCEGYYELS
jgi:hypothetical protein